MATQAQQGRPPVDGRGPYGAVTHRPDDGASPTVYAGPAGWRPLQLSLDKHNTIRYNSPMTTVNGNVATWVPKQARQAAYDWPDIDNETHTVRIWRGTPKQPHASLLLTFHQEPSEVADWLELLAQVIRRKVSNPTCERCRKPIEQDLTTGRPRRYCSDACRQAAYRARTT